MHASINFPTKKSLIAAVKEGRTVTVLPTPFTDSLTDGTAYISGPWNYHTWYAQATVKDGRIVKVK